MQIFHTFYLFDGSTNLLIFSIRLNSYFSSLGHLTANCVIKRRAAGKRSFYNLVDTVVHVADQPAGNSGAVQITVFEHCSSANVV